MLTSNTIASSARSACEVFSRVLLAALFSVGFFATTSKAVLVHQYTFQDGTANDSVGNAHGSLMQGATISDGRVRLDGTDDFVDLPGSTIQINTFDEVTFELWHSQPTNDQGFSMTAAFGNTFANGNGQDYLMISTTRGNQTSRAAIANTPDEEEPWLDEVGVDGPELNDGLVHHYVVTVDATDINYYVDGELQGTAELGETSLADLSNQFAYLGKGVYSVDGTVEGSIHEFSIWDNALDANAVQAEFINGAVGGAGIGPSLLVNRETGEVSLQNDLGSIDVISYSITSAAGALNPGNWESIAATGDSDSGGSVDPDDTWEVLVNTVNEISEEEPFDGGGPADPMRKGTPVFSQVEFSMGAITPRFVADITIFDGSAEQTLGIPVFYEGNDGEPFMRSDFDFDGDIDGDDFATLVANNLTELSGTTPLETYAEGDVNGDLMNDFQDFRLFQQDFDAANGAGAFAALTASQVPEPGTGVLLAGLLVAGVCGSRVFRRR